MWRNSPYFEQQFAMVCRLGDSALELPFVRDVQHAPDDEALLVFSDWLEERNDSRAQYIRDMCELSGVRRPAPALMDRVNAFEDAQESRPALYFRTLPTCTIAVISHAMMDLDAQRRVPTEFGSVFTADSQTRFVFDMHRARFVTAEFLGNLISFMRVTRHNNREFPVLIMTGTVREVFQITRLDHIFPVCSNLDEALDLLEPA